MKKIALYFLFLFNLFFFTRINAQLAAPDLRCVSVATPTTAVLTWVIPPDPTGIFSQYQIWTSVTGLPPFNLIGVVNTYTQTSFTHAPTPVGNQSQYYYVTTVSSGTNISTPSDTLKTLFVNLTGSSVNGVSSLNWNAMRVPLLPTSSTSYTVSREAPVGVWTPIYSGSGLSYKDTIYKCKIFYNYKVEISDALGCISRSNIKGDTCRNKQAPYAIELDSVSVNTSGQAVMGWQPSLSQDIDCYVIYSSNGGFLTEVGRVCGVNNTSFTYTASAAGSSSEGYCIAAVDSCGNFNIPSLTHNSIFMTAPTYDLCSRTANLTWTPYSNLAKGVLKYDVYCSTNSGVYNLIGSSTTTNFSHSGLVPGDVYCYFVRVRNTDLSISASSNIQCFTATGLPAPTFVYVNSVSVNTYSKFIEVTYTVDTTKTFKGCVIYKSLDGISFSKIAYVTSTVSPYTYVDKDVKATEKIYYYKVEVADECENPGVVSNISKNIVLKVYHDNESLFNNVLTWDDYTTWLGGVESFNIYRAVNGIFDPTPIVNVPVGTWTYNDNVQDFVSAQGKFSYYVEAVEGIGNTYGFKDMAKSNPSDAYVEVNIYVPNAFAPKGINNIWLPMAQYVEKTDYKVMVFNRYGVKIFETHSDVEGWTGDAATDDVYVYLIEYKNARGEYIQLKGHLNIVR